MTKKYKTVKWKGAFVRLQVETLPKFWEIQVTKSRKELKIVGFSETFHLDWFFSVHSSYKLSFSNCLALLEFTHYQLCVFSFNMLKCRLKFKSQYLNFAVVNTWCCLFRQNGVRALRKSSTFVFYVSFENSSRFHRSVSKWFMSYHFAEESRQNPPFNPSRSYLYFSRACVFNFWLQGLCVEVEYKSNSEAGSYFLFYILSLVGESVFSVCSVSFYFPLTRFIYCFSYFFKNHVENHVFWQKQQ